MAFIPDEAIERSHTLTASAFRLYCLLCRRRDHRQGVSRLSRSKAVSLLRLKKSAVYKSFADLKEFGWIKETDQNEFRLLEGNFYPVDKKFLSANDSANMESNSTETENFSRHAEKNSTKMEKDSAKMENLGYKEYPASSSRNFIQPTQHSKTANGAVRVSSENFSENGFPNSQFSLEECLQYVEVCEQNGEAIRNPKGLATNLFQTGQADGFILATLYPERQKEAERKIFGDPRKFSGDPCRVCFGAKMSDTDGKGFRPCEHCRDEKGKPKGFEPLA